MSTSNPYKSPTGLADGPGDVIARPIRLPYMWSAGLLFIGLWFLLLLNGQVFTNALVFLGVAVVSALLWVPLVVRTPRHDHQYLAHCAILGHLVLIIALVTGLPEKYRSQKRFNNVVTDLRQRRGVHDLDHQPTVNVIR